MSRSLDYVVLCVLDRLANMSWRQCLGDKFLRCVNVSTPASTWMVRYAISIRYCSDIIYQNIDTWNKIKFDTYVICISCFGIVIV